MADDRLIVVLDVGKTLAKLSLWTPGGELVARDARANQRIDAGAYVALDAGGIEAWVAETLGEFARKGRVGAIVPVAHGAAAAIVRGGELVLPPLDYEAAIPQADRDAYERERDPFAQTGSPALPDGLNLGAQLHYLERLHPGVLEGAQILPWPQYWAWRLSGVAASEATSLGCHSDLWRPGARAPAARRRAGHSLGTNTAPGVDRSPCPGCLATRRATRSSRGEVENVQRLS